MNTILHKATQSGFARNAEKSLTPYDQIAQIYADKNQQANRAVAKARNRFLSEVAQGGVILDVGCGSGRDLSYFENLGFQTYGVDNSKALCDIAKGNSNSSEVLNIGMLDMDFPHNSFDGVWASASLHHLRKKELPLLLGKIYSMLQENGVFFGSLKRGTGEGFETDGYEREHQIYVARYMNREIQTLLSNSGFERIEILMSPRWVSFFAFRIA